MSNYINYHSHSHYSNVIVPDSTISNKDRANRVLELEQNVLSSVEHGYVGRPIEIIELSKQYNLKPLLGVETYYVRDRKEKDKTNAHLILLAKNEEGRKEINWALSEGNVSGYYYRARIDDELLFNINPNNVWVTSACLGGIWKYEDADDIVLKMKSYFGLNFFLEVQAHNVEPQKELNQRIVNLSKKHNIKIIAGADSHMIFPNQAKDRDDYLLSRGIEYPEEQGWFLDFPSYDEFKNRFEIQGILNKNQIVEALDNTNIFQNVEEYSSIIFDNTKIKLPTIYPTKNQEEKDNIFKNMVWNLWSLEKDNVPEEKWNHYEEEIQKEMDIILETGMSDYFLLNYEVVKKGKELGGSITLTGRGSAPSFYITKLLGLTTIDRISASVKMFPERFISKERLLETKSLPDFDFNLGTPEIFAQAQVEIVGEGRSYPMIAFGTTKNLSAWKLYARSAGIDFDTSNHVSEQLTQFELDYKHAEEDDKENLNVLDYIDKELHQTFLESRKYIGLVNSLTIHPCGYLLADFDLRKEFGLIKIKTGNVEHICVACDGLFAEQYKLLKNDLLKVAVVDLIYRTYKRIGIKPHPLPELLKICENNEKVWNIYKSACGMGINQIEQPGTVGRVAKYAPTNISELSAFVAAIRPGFKSNYKQFEAREKFEYGIPTLDKLIQTDEFPQSYMLYQENAMSVMAYAKIPMYETYEIIKNIAKKRYAKVIKYKEQFTGGMKEKLIEEKVSMRDSEETASMTWQIIEDSSRYSFNCSHSYSVAGDSLYGAWLKANYPYEFYEVFLQMLEDDADKERLAKTKIEAEKHFGIKFPPYRFGQDNRGIIADKKNKTISSSLKSIKSFNHQISEDLYELGKNKYNTFIDFLIDAEENGYISSKFEKLIKIKYFQSFGNNKKLLTIWEEFKKGKNRYAKKLSDKSKEKRIPLLLEIEKNTPNDNLTFREQILAEQEILEHVQAVYPNVDKKYIYVMGLNDKYAPRVQAYSINGGTQSTLKIYKAQFAEKPFGFGDILYCKSFEKKFAVKYVDGEYLENKEQIVWWLTDYNVIQDVDKIIGG